MNANWYKNDTDMDQYVKDLNEYFDSGQAQKYFGYEKYECFNSLSTEDKNIFIDSIIEGALHDLRYGYDVNEDLSNTVYAEDFETLPYYEQEKRMSRYIDEILGESRNG